MMRRLATAVVCLVVMGILVAGCNSQPKMSETPMTGTMEEPQWVTKGVSAFPDEAGEALFGVGIAEKTRVPMLSLRRTTAIEQARLDVARQLRSFVQGVFKDYAEAALTPNMEEAESQSLVSNVYKSIVDETLIGVQPIDTWTHPRTGDLYALVKVSMESIGQQLRNKIIAVEKERLRVDAAEAHKELDEIIEKNRQRLK